MLRVQWLCGGLSGVGVGLGGSLGVDVVAGQIQFLVGGGRSLVVGGVVGMSAWRLVRRSHALMLSRHGGV